MLTLVALSTWIYDVVDVPSHKQGAPMVLSLWSSWDLDISVFAVDSTYISVNILPKSARGFDYCLKPSASVKKKIGQCNRIRRWNIIINAWGNGRGGNDSGKLIELYIFSYLENLHNFIVCWQYRWMNEDSPLC